MAESGKNFESNVIRLEQDEHATPEYQRIHPKGLVPALVEDGRLYIESIDIIGQVAGADTQLADVSDRTMLELADAAQLDLKLLTFEFLFRSNPPPPKEVVEAFQKGHKNEWLLKFREDFARGFDPDKINAAIARTGDGFEQLNARLADGRTFLEGEHFTLSDIAWMPNVHRFRLMGWPFEEAKHLFAWFQRVSARESYQKALLDWQPDPVVEGFEAYTRTRQAAQSDIQSYPYFTSRSEG